MNNRDSVFTGSNHHVLIKIHVLETPEFPPYYAAVLYKAVCLFVSVQIMGFDAFDAFVPVCGDIQQFTPQKLIGFLCVVSLAIPLCHLSLLLVMVLKLNHDNSVSIFPTRDSKYKYISFQHCCLSTQRLLEFNVSLSQ